MKAGGACAGARTPPASPAATLASYRFCRTDDIPLLVAAHASCYAVHFRDEPPFSVEQFKNEVNELNLWASSCVLAIVHKDPVGVVMATKRSHETLILRIGIQAGHQRQGHGRHLLNSLSRKLAILGPPRLAAEIPDDKPDVATFFSACGFRPEGSFADYVQDRNPEPVPAADLVTPITFAELTAAGAWETSITRAWERTRETLENRVEQLQGLAVASESRIEAWLLHRRSKTGTRQVVGLGHAPGGQAATLLGILMAQLAGADSTPLTLPRVAPEEVDAHLLHSWGFRRTRKYTRFAAEPVAG